jgi:uncharacterized protein DUF6221
MTLVEFLTARLDEDEQSAHEAEDSLGKLNMAWSFQPDGDLGGKVLARDHYVMIPKGTTTIAQHIARHDPARILREVEAKRRIIIEHHPVDPCDAHDVALGTISCDTLRLLALPYADHPDYDERWRQHHARLRLRPWRWAM